ncbi:MAG: cation:dicarboxylase symporter family transporter [Saprospiraceae bacterium]|nr:cation:dicarboxylase symporter family transporter [Saprospiraceae bacterium]
MNKRLLLLIALLLCIAGISVEWADALPLATGKTLRWTGISLLAWYLYKYNNKLSMWILFSMLVGTEIGYDFPGLAIKLEVLSKVFLKLIKTVIAPLLFGTLVVGIAGHSNIKQVGRMGLKALIYFEVVTSLALVVGLVAINFTQAGKGIASPEVKAEIIKAPASDLSVEVDSVKNTYKLSFLSHTLEQAKPPTKQNWEDIVLHTFPENVAKMIHEGQVLQIVVFSILFAIAMTMVSASHRQVMFDFAESLSEIMFKFTNIIMYFAPFAVGGAIAFTIGKMGFAVVGNLVMLLLTLYGALIAFILLVLVPIAYFCDIPIKKFFKAVSEPATIAFATASSEAALPKALKIMEEFGVPKKIVAFVIPTGYSFNLDGTTLYLSLASVFVAQAAGIDLSITQQIIICLTLMLTSKGVAGVPRASLVILAGTTATFGLPDWPLAIILGVDALMDMGRTSTNVIGNCLATVVVAKWEGEWDRNTTPELNND